jgi:hypothetical protein
MTQGEELKRQEIRTAIGVLFFARQRMVPSRSFRKFARAGPNQRQIYRNRLDPARRVAYARGVESQAGPAPQPPTLCQRPICAQSRSPVDQSKNTFLVDR